MKPSVFIVGPTASGKSALALALAERIGGEIITVDSMQVYRGLDIGTAKPTAEERARVPHHLLDVVNLDEPFDAAKFVTLARQAEADIQGRGRTPIFCGGTGLYVKAYREGLGNAPPSEPELRAEIERTPLLELLRELEEKDPTTFQQIDRQNPRRVVRAIEVIRLTGRAYSEQRSAWRTAATHATGVAGGTPALPGDDDSAYHLLGVIRSAADLRARIDARVDEMFARGLVSETRSLLERGLEANQTAMQAIGYRQVVEHLRGARPLDATIELVKTKTRQFAKRQMTWFKRQLAVEWMEASGDVRELAGRVIAAAQVNSNQ